MASYTADGNVSPCRFVTPSGEWRVAQSVTGDSPVGVSCEAQFNAPIPNASTYAASQDQPLKVYTEGQQCLLEVAGSVSAGQYLKPDADGKGVVIDNTANDTSGARAISDGAAGEKILVEVLNQKGS